MPKVILPVAYYRKENGRARTHAPGAVVDVSDREARRLRGKYGAGIVVRAAMVDHAVVLSPAIDITVEHMTHPFDHDGDGYPGGSLPADPTPETMTPDALIASEAAGLDYHTFVAEARQTLGDRMPASRRKADILEALKEAAR
jgi:hypothetical protein